MNYTEIFIVLAVSDWKVSCFSSLNCIIYLNTFSNISEVIHIVDKWYLVDIHDWYISLHSSTQLESIKLCLCKVSQWQCYLLRSYFSFFSCFFFLIFIIFTLTQVLGVWVVLEAKTGTTRGTLGHIFVVPLIKTSLYQIKHY